MMNSNQYMKFIDHQDPTKTPLTTCVFREITEMNMSYISPSITLKEPQINNPRGYLVESASFKINLEKEIQKICLNASNELPYSRIYGPIVESLELLNVADLNILIIYSDMIERYSEDLQFTEEFLQKNSDDTIIKKLEEAYQLHLPKSLSNIVVYIIYDPGIYRNRINKSGKKYDTADLAYRSALFFKRILEQRKAQVFISSRL
jgi:hypothetical protein